jgi:hypothetical protein
MSPSALKQAAGDRFREQVLTHISVALLRRRISGRRLSTMVAGEGSHGWWSKRYNGELALTVSDLGAIADVADIPVAELLGLQTAELDPTVAHLNEFLGDADVPRSVKDDVLGALGHMMRLGYQRATRRPARGRASVRPAEKKASRGR